MCIILKHGGLLTCHNVWVVWLLFYARTPKGPNTTQVIDTKHLGKRWNATIPIGAEELTNISSANNRHNLEKILIMQEACSKIWRIRAPVNWIPIGLHIHIYWGCLWCKYGLWDLLLPNHQLYVLCACSSTLTMGFWRVCSLSCGVACWSFIRPLP